MTRIADEIRKRVHFPRTRIRPAAGAWLGGLAMVILVLPGISFTQSPPDANTTHAEWRVVGRDGDEIVSFRGPSDSLSVVLGRATALLQQRGHYFADVDSVVPANHTIYAAEGPYVSVGDIQISGLTTVDLDVLLTRLETRPGTLLDGERLERDLQFVLGELERAGRPLAQITLDSVDVFVDDGPRLRLFLSVDEGHRLRFHSVELEGRERTSPKFVERILGLRAGQDLVPYEPLEYQRRLQESGIFAEVGFPELSVDHDMNAVLRIPVTEESPGTFDLVLGYLPPATGGGRGSITGNGHILVRNLFGQGRVIGLRLNRIPGQVSTIDVRASDPYVAGMPLRIEGRFHGHQQDSLYGNQRVRLEAGYRFPGGFETFVTGSREYTRPGVAGVNPARGREPVPRADTWFVGIGIRYSRLDFPANPRRGLSIETNLEQGRRDRTFLGAMPSDPTRAQSVALRQQRLTATGRLYLPTWPRQVLVAGGDALVLLSNEYDESDLFRVGGAYSLRGYDEERFLASAFGRMLGEYRYQIDRSSFMFAFAEAGLIERPALGETPAEQRIRPGYGFGIQYSTGIGLMTVSYALNPEEGPTDGRVHVGVSIGL